MFWALVLGATLLGAGRAEANIHRIRLRGLVSSGTMLSSDQRQGFGYDRVAVGGSLMAGYLIAGPLGAELRVASSTFLSGRDAAGGLTEFGGGLLVDLDTRLSGLRWGPAAHASVARTGQWTRPAIDIGIRATFDVGRAIAVGPEAFYGHVFQKNGDLYSTDARYWMVGLALGWRPPAGAPPPPRPQVRERVTERVERIENTVFIETPPPTAAPEPSADLDALLNEAIGPRRTETHLIPPILFEFDSTEVLACGEAALYLARDKIAAIPNAIEIEGHADTTGTDGYNDELSQHRADRVRQWLIDHGIAAERIRMRALGETHPWSGSFERNQQQVDRRVTFRVLDAPASP